MMKEKNEYVKEEKGVEKKNIKEWRRKKGTEQDGVITVVRISSTGRQNAV
jgi:hypothetical protein